MKVYGMRGIKTIAVGETKHVHTAAEPGEQIVIDCDACTPHLLARYDFAAEPDAVPKNRDEILAEERAEKEGNIAMQNVGAKLVEVARNVDESPTSEVAKLRQQVADLAALVESLTGPAKPGEVVNAPKPRTRSTRS